MKILFLTNKPPYPPVDGGTIATMALVNGFSRLGHEVTVLAMNTRKHHITPFQIPDDVAAAITFHLVEVTARISLPALLQNLFFSKLPYNAERFISTRYSRKLATLLKKQDFDLVQLEGLYLTPYIPCIRKHSKAKIAYRSHNIEHEIWERSVEQSKGLKKLYIKNLAKRIEKFEVGVLNSYDFLVPITQRDFNILNNAGNTKPGIAIPSGIDNPVKPSVTILSGEQLFFIGALDWVPNQEGLLWFIENCWGKILTRLPGVKLAIAGRNAPKWFLSKIAVKNVVFMGEVDDANEFMLKNGIMIAPLLSGSGMRIKIIEGMALGKVIVTTSIGCEGIDATHEKEILIADDKNDYAYQVIRILNDAALQAKISENSFKFVVRNYSNHNLALRLAGFYKKNC
jgi:glycosyltransferase involved in cell wall biosynthesis